MPGTTDWMVVVVLGGDLLQRVPVVAGHVVDQHGEVAQRLGCIGDRGLQRRHVAHITAAPPERGRAEPLRERAARGLIDVDERHARTLRDEGFDHRRTDAAAPAGDENRPVFQARIGGG
jgi:hypothetical protein